MALQIGIIGMPNVGKSTLFNALLKKRVALSANYPFATIEPNTGVVAVPDSRLQTLATIVKAEEKMDSLPPIIPAVCEFVDIAGLVKGASTGAGLGNQFLSHIREVDAIVHVLRDFDDANIVREGSTDPKSDRETVETELALSDLQVIEKLVAAQEKQVRGSKDPLEEEKVKILKLVQDDLSEGKVLGKYHIGEERLKVWFDTLPLLTIKPLLYVFNVSEEEYAEKLKQNVILVREEVQWTSESHPGLDSGQARMTPSASSYAMTDSNTLVICAKVEEELVDLDEGEREEYLKELGILEPGLDRLIKKAYQTLGLISFLTAGKKEVRAWTVKSGSKAPQAAGVIHTDFEKGFIRAQVIEFEKYIEAGSLKTAKEKGWLRTEGKEYVIKDGDVVEFLVSA